MADGTKTKRIIDGPVTTTINKTALDAIRPTGKEYIVFDDTLTGFGIRVRESGSMSYIVHYRVGSGRKAPQRKYTISSTSKIAPDEARKIAREVLADVVKGRDPANEKSQDRSAITFAMLAADYLEIVASKKKCATHYLYKHWLNDLAVPVLGKRKARDIGTNDVEKLHVSLEATPITANRVLTTISSMYTWAMGPGKKLEKMENPAAGIEKFKEQGRERYLTNEELGRLGEAIRRAEIDGIPWEPDPRKKIKHAPRAENRLLRIDPWSAAALRLYILTGARRGEILKLKWDNVDLERGLLFLDDSKTDKKTIILNAPAITILRTLPRIDQYVIPGQASSGEPGKSRPRSDLKRPWQLVRKEAKLDASADNPRFRVRLHDLRHTHASVGVGSNLSLQIVGKLLGHTQVKTTERYAHLADDPVRNASELIGSKIAEAMGDSRTPPQE